MSLTKIGSIGINTGIQFAGVTTIATLNSSSNVLSVGGTVNFNSDVSIGGSVSIGGTLTYEDVTNIDSVGLITARNGVVVGSGITLSKDGDGFYTGIVTATTFVGAVTGTSSNASGATGDFSIADKIIHTGDTDTALRFPAADTITAETGGSERLRITGIGSVGINATNPNALLEVRGTAGTYTNAITVFSGNTTHSGSNAKNGIALHSFGDALSGGLSSNLLYSNSSSPTQSYATRSSGEITFDNTTSSSQTSVIKFGGYYKGTTSFVERLRITSGGNLLLGTDTETNNIRLGNKLGVVGTTAYTGMSITNYPGTNAQHSPLFDFNRSRGTSDGSLTSVVAGDKLGELIFRGSNGSDFTDAVALRAFAENVAGSHVNGKFEIQTYQGGAASVKVGVSSEGHVTKPSQPYFVARAGSSRNDVTNQVLVFDTAVRNNGNHYSTSTSKFTAPVEGAYIFGGSPAYMETDDTMSIVIRKNGSTVYEVERVVAGSMTQHSMFGFSTLLYLAADDEVDLYILGQCHQNGTYSHWFGYLLG